MIKWITMYYRGIVYKYTTYCSGLLYGLVILRIAGIGFATVQSVLKTYWIG